jgi:hypothetical protein
MQAPQTWSLFRPRRLPGAERQGCPSGSHRVRAAALAAVAALALGPVQALDLQWVGGTGSWHDAANWSPAGIPGAGDRALIASGSVSLSFAEMVGGLVMSGGTLSGAQLTVTGAASLSAGTLTGAGTTRFEGDLLLGGNSLRTISGGRIVETAGATTWSGNSAANGGSVRFDTGGGRIVNSGAWTDANSFSATLGSGPSIGNKFFDNLGSYSKAGASTTTVSLSFANSGEVQVLGGTLALIGGADSVSTGLFHVDQGATLSFGSGAGSTGLATLSDASFSGGGRVLVDANTSALPDVRIIGSSTHQGLLEVANGNLVVDGSLQAATLLQRGGTVEGSGSLRVLGDAVWSAGVQGGSGSTVFAGDLAITGNGSKLVTGGRVLHTEGNTFWGGHTQDFSNSIQFNVAGRIVNTGSWQVDHRFEAAMGSGAGGSEKLFDNAGLFVKTGDGLTNLNVAFANTGTLRVEQGTLALRGAADSLSTGHFHVETGATLAFGRGGSSGLATLDGVNFSGSGRLQVDGNGSPLVDLRLIGNASHAGELMMSGGHFDVDGSFTVARYGSDGGSLQGGGLLLVTGTALIDGGTMAGSGTTRFAGDLAITGNSQTLWAGTRRVETAGTTVWGAGSGGSSLLMNGAITVVNSGTWIDANQTAVGIGSGSTLAPGKWFINEGHFIKSGAGTTTWYANFVNLGRVSVGAGAVMDLAGWSFSNTGLLDGHGTLRINGTLLNDGRIAPGSSTGTLRVDGAMQLQAQSLLSFELASLSDFDRLLVSGQATLGGALELLALGYEPVLGDSFTLMSFAGRAGSLFESFSWSGFGPEVRFELEYLSQEVRLHVTAVPEPGSLALWVAGLLLLALSRPGPARRATAPAPGSSNLAGPAPA